MLSHIYADDNLVRNINSHKITHKLSHICADDSWDVFTKEIKSQLSISRSRILIYLEVNFLVLEINFEISETWKIWAQLFKASLA